MNLLRIGSLGCVVILGACGGDGGVIGHEPTVDTLPDGSLLVGNSELGQWDVEPETRWSVVERVRIGSREGPDLFGRVQAVVVDDLGRMWVADAQANELLVFDADGRFVRTVGGTGEGPGEFMRIGPAFHGPDGTIWVEDLSLVRWEVFDTAGARVEGHRSPSSLRGGWRQWTRDGLFLVMEPHPEADEAVLGVYRKAEDGVLAYDGRFLALPPERAGQLITLESGIYSLQVPIPFAPQPQGAFGPDLDFWTLSRAAGDACRPGRDADPVDQRDRHLRDRHR